MAQAKKTTKKKGLQPFYYVLIGLAVLGIAAIALTVVRNRGGGAALEPVPLQGLTNEQLVTRAQGVELGPDNAPVKMLVFSDYQCPYCGTFAAQIEPALKSEFIDQGKLQLVYYDFPLGGSHRHSFLAARAARCAGDQGKFWEYHNTLFGRQSEWSFSEAPPVGMLLDFADETGIDRGDLESCVKSDKYQDVVSASRQLGDQLGINATPTLLVNGKRVRADIGLDIEALRELLRSELGEPQT